MIAISPTFLMNQPVTKDGPNIPRLCHMITQAVDSNAWCECDIASGAAVINIAITLCAINTDAVAATKLGWTTMVPRRTLFLRRLGGGERRDVEETSAPARSAGSR